MLKTNVIHLNEIKKMHQSFKMFIPLWWHVPTTQWFPCHPSTGAIKYPWLLHDTCWCSLCLFCSISSHRSSSNHMGTKLSIQIHRIRFVDLRPKCFQFWYRICPFRSILVRLWQSCLVQKLFGCTSKYRLVLHERPKSIQLHDLFRGNNPCGLTKDVFLPKYRHRHLWLWKSLATWLSRHPNCPKALWCMSPFLREWVFRSGKFL